MVMSKRKKRPVKKQNSKAEATKPEKSSSIVLMEKTFPEDVVLNILSRLPVKSVGRFMTVEKRWHELINGSYFTTLHTNQSSLRKGNPYLALICSGNDFKLNITFISQNTNKVSKVIEIPRGCSNDCHERIDKLVGCVHGVFCLTVPFYGGYCNYLFNPAIREFKVLPVPASIDREPNRIFTTPSIGLGFGFDHINRDYKIVRIFDSRTEWETILDLNLDVIKLYSEVDVYSLNSDCWRRTGIRLDAVVEGSICKEAVNVNEYLHWNASKVRGTVRLSFILAFDVCNEVFHEIMLPGLRDDQAENLRYWKICAIKGSLSLFVAYENETSRSFDMWMMEEYGVRESWTKQYTIPGELELERLIGFGTNGEVYGETFCRRVVMYDTTTQKEKNLGYFGITMSAELFEYSESIVPIKGKKVPKESTWFGNLLPWIYAFLAFLVGFSFSLLLSKKRK